MESLEASKISITKLLKVIKESSIQFDEKLLKDNLKQNFSEFLIDDFIHQKQQFSTI